MSQKYLLVTAILVAGLMPLVAKADGASVYMATCLTCHGANYDGLGDAGKYMKPKPRNFMSETFVNGDSPDQIYKTITDGFKGGTTGMVSFAKSLSDADRKAVAEFVAGLKKKK